MTAQKVSQILREGGLPKASPYKVWGRDREGFLVIKSDKNYKPDSGDVCTVHLTAHYEDGRRMYEQAQEILTAAGVEWAPYGRPGVGGTYGLRVPKAVAA